MDRQRAPDVPSPPSRSIAILLFDGITALDVVGPYEALNRIPGVGIRLCAARRGSVRTESGSLAFHADHPLSEIADAEILVVPGGSARGVSTVVRDAATLDWIRRISASAEWTTSVCTGSLLLGAAGLLEGSRATTHWRARDLLSRFGATYLDERVVESGSILTSAGVSAGIELGLRLAEKIAGPEIARAIELSMHYDPDPPFGTGSPSKASPETIEIATNGLAGRDGDSNRRLDERNSSSDSSGD